MTDIGGEPYKKEVIDVPRKSEFRNEFTVETLLDRDWWTSDARVGTGVVVRVRGIRTNVSWEWRNVCHRRPTTTTKVGRRGQPCILDVRSPAQVWEQAAQGP